MGNFASSYCSKKFLLNLQNFLQLVELVNRFLFHDEQLQNVINEYFSTFLDAESLA